jgi:uncharacterized membrane protein
MGIDIRLPIGVLFLLLGVILTAYGALAGASNYRQPLDMNINLIWGLVLLVFGILMTVLGRRGARAAAQAEQSDSKSPNSSGHR